MIMIFNNHAKVDNFFGITRDRENIFYIVINYYSNSGCSKKAEYRELITEMNVLAAKYDQLLMARKTRNQNKRDNS